MTPTSLTRRQTLVGATGLGLTIDFLGSRAFADADHTSRKMVVVICRGGLDGLSLSPPVGDPNYQALRGPIAIAPFGAPGGALRLDDTFGLHPALTSVYAMAMNGEARIAPAIATPDRERSHFEAQDVLESGAGRVYASSSGWLNRALEAMGPPGRVKALSVGPTAPLILRGKIEAASWSPGGGGQSDRRLPAILQDLYAHDSLLGPALAEGLATEAMAKTALADGAATDAAFGQSTQMSAHPANAMQANGPQAPARQAISQVRKMGATVAGFMVQPDGVQVTAVSLDNFDTHANQGAAGGQLAGRLTYVDAFLDGLKAGLGPSWRDTIVVMATEFGRTVRVNGTNGTDHGTASTALVLGGALRRGGIIGDWPTLRQASLFENRDTFPTLDMRGLFKGVLRDHMGIGRAALDGTVFPGSADVAPVAEIVA